ncbi:MAG: c-type cytochrome [Pseudomonadales bacterium]
MIHRSHHSSTSARFPGASALAATLVALLAAPVVAAPSPEERAAYAVDSRQSVLHLMGYYIGPLAGMARGQLPVDLSVIANNAGRIATLAPMIPETFSVDTRSFELETEALDVIWEQSAEFKAKAATLQEKAEALSAMATAGSEDGIRPAIGAMGQACGSCHDEFRVDDE